MLGDAGIEIAFPVITQHGQDWTAYSHRALCHPNGKERENRSSYRIRGRMETLEIVGIYNS
jgi:hypothetical protein